MATGDITLTAEQWTSIQAEIAGLTAGMSAANQLVNSLEGQISVLQEQLATLPATLQIIVNLRAQIAAAQAALA